MLTKYFREQFISNACRFLLLIALLLVAMPLFAQGQTAPSVPSLTNQVANLNAQSVFQNIITQIPYFMRLVTAIAYVLGMYFIFASIIKFKHFGEARTQMSHEHSIMAPIVMMGVGAALLYLPSSVQVGMSTFWTNPNPYAYVEQQDQWSQFINGCFMVIQLIGTIAFIRGLVLLSHVGGQHGGGQGNFGKGLTHVIAGVLCINIYQFVQVILATIGIQT